ncbi:hypothetical protein [Bradyrhizobium sp. McL0616]|uniref:hypothetical protein n=1 Tax=Bradyrhizobium sp. McL0616 TaxID=3415674 RepID=UPI003CFBBEE6
MPLSLSDEELAAVMDAATPLQPHQRSEFLRDVSAELASYEVVGPGVIHRIVRELQRAHLNRHGFTTTASASPAVDGVQSTRRLTKCSLDQ